MECRQPPAPRLFVYARPARKRSDGASNENQKQSRAIGVAQCRQRAFEGRAFRRYRHKDQTTNQAFQAAFQADGRCAAALCKARLRTNRHSFRAHDARGICTGRESAFARAGCVPNRSCLIFGGMCLRRPRSQPVQNAWKRNGFARKHSLPCYLRMR